MAFVVHGQSVADLRIAGLTARPALGFGRLLVEVELLVHERRQTERLSLVEFGGEILVRDAHDALHYLGRLTAMRAPVAVAVHQPGATVELEIEIEGARLNALRALRVGEDLALELTIRGRLELGTDSHIVTSAHTHRLSRTAWTDVLAQLSA